MPRIHTTKSRFEVARYSAKCCHLLLLKWVDDKLIALFDVKVMSSDIKMMSKRKEWHKPINKMNLPRDRNCSY